MREGEGMQGAAVSCHRIAEMGGGERRGFRELPLAARKWHKWEEGRRGAAASYQYLLEIGNDKKRQGMRYDATS